MKGYIQLSLHGFWLTGHSTLSSYVLVLMSYEMKEVRDEGMDVQVTSSKKRKIQPPTWRGTYVGMVRMA